jgi:OFA family oxalate/formate antiporter-like MFS transporter
MTDGEPGVDYAGRARDVLGVSRWWQLAAAVGMMAAVSPYQYVWSSIAPPLSENLDIAPAALGAVFSLYVVFQSLSQFPAGWWRDRHGPRALVFLAGLLAAGGYIGLAYATSVIQLYVLYSLGAVGVGIVYTVAVNTAVKWFPDRTGVTTGAGTMGFAAGSVLAVPYVRANATVESYPVVLRTVGLVILVVLLGGGRSSSGTRPRNGSISRTPRHRMTSPRRSAAPPTPPGRCSGPGSSGCCTRCSSRPRAPT